ncbi:hypothetical protein ATN89_17285 [Comamonas thiooxydans]|uniref:hypothetical protein n=1 Tax=Comamonas thiooxydans TaxID=363952 RepID=UPI0007CD3720|nr:hypothetical protein [Comamonas thiooxydans]OAD82837.1 hypothetical protein ATN89_17285 [Comamonas thiooxydans]
MNILTLVSCGHITPKDDFAIMIQNVTTLQARQFGLLLALSNKSDAVFQFLGMDMESGEMLPGELVVTYEDALKAVQAKEQQ